MTLITTRQMLRRSSLEKMYLRRKLNKLQQMIVTKPNRMQQPHEKANLLKKLKKNKRKRIKRSRKISRLKRKKRKKICPTCYPKVGRKVPHSPRLAILSAFREMKRESNQRA